MLFPRRVAEAAVAVLLIARGAAFDVYARRAPRRSNSAAKGAAAAAGSAGLTQQQNVRRDVRAQRVDGLAVVLSARAATRVVRERAIMGAESGEMTSGKSAASAQQQQAFGAGRIGLRNYAPSLYDSAGPVQRLTFAWISDLVDHTAALRYRGYHPTAGSDARS